MKDEDKNQPEKDQTQATQEVKPPEAPVASQPPAVAPQTVPTTPPATTAIVPPPDQPEVQAPAEPVQKAQKTKKPAKAKKAPKAPKARKAPFQYGPDRRLCREIKDVSEMRKVWTAHFSHKMTFVEIEEDKSFKLKLNNGMTSHHICAKYAKLKGFKFPVDKAKAAEKVKKAQTKARKPKATNASSPVADKPKFQCQRPSPKGDGLR